MGSQKIIAFILWLFLGSLGAHRFYAGKIGTGFLLLILTVFSAATWAVGAGIFTGALVGIWLIIDLILIITGGLFKG